MNAKDKPTQDSELRQQLHLLWAFDKTSPYYEVWEKAKDEIVKMHEAMVNEAAAKDRQQLTDLFLQCVGEDEVFDGRVQSDLKKDGRNDLRAEIRQKLLQASEGDK